MVLGLLCVAPGVHRRRVGRADRRRLLPVCEPASATTTGRPAPPVLGGGPDVVGSFVPMTELNSRSRRARSPTTASRSRRRSSRSNPRAPPSRPRRVDAAHAGDGRPGRAVARRAGRRQWLLARLRHPGQRHAARRTRRVRAAEAGAVRGVGRLCLREHRVTFVLWEQPGPLALHDEDAAIPAATSEAAPSRGTLQPARPHRPPSAPPTHRPHRHARPAAGRSPPDRPSVRAQARARDAPRSQLPRDRLRRRKVLRAEAVVARKRRRGASAGGAPHPDHGAREAASEGGMRH